MFFESSVNNLNVGAKVKWKGVPVGQVSDIRIRWNQDVLSTEVPVFVQIDLTRLGMELDDPKVLRQEIANGMRAQMQWESLISGMLFIELNYVPNAGPPKTYEKEPLYPEIPAVSSPFDAIGDMAFEIADNLRQIDFKRISDNLNSSLERVNRTLDELDTPGLSRSLKSAANSVTSLAGSPEAMRMIEDASATMKSLQSVAARLDGMAEPMPGQLKELSDQVTATLASIQATSDRLREA
ncbi:MAG: MlaD family protein, partial [Opitutales bacterium]